MIAEDEENCLQVYKYKGLIQKTANFFCQSAMHNSDSLTIRSNIFNNTKLASGLGIVESRESNVTIIDAGTIVNILATKCDGIPECWHAIDEFKCGSSTFETIIIGMCI